MKITSEAKDLLQGIFNTNDSDCLRATLQQSCCGSSLVFSMAKAAEDDQPTLIDGVSVLMDGAAKERSEAVTIAVEDGDLAIRDEAAATCC